MKKTAFIESVRVKDPCTQAWDEMVGNDKVRFCTHCAKDVNNLSAITRKEALKLIRKSGGSLCIRYIQHPKTKRPLFAEQLTQITRRAPIMAAGVMSASLSLATLTYAQGGAAPPSPERNLRTTISECEEVVAAKKDENRPGAKTSAKTNPASVESGVLSGGVLDTQGAVIPNATVTLRDAADRAIKSVSSDEDGRFRFDALQPGRYSLNTDAHSGFTASRVENIEINSDRETVMDITLQVSAAVAGGMIIEESFEGALTIAVSQEDIDEVRNLIARREKVNYREEDGTTPIFVAVENGNIEILQLLLDSGAKVNVRKDGKETPLMSLDDDASAEMVDLLLRYGAKVNQVATNGDTALIKAAGSVGPAVIKALIDAGADINAQNDEGISALMNAAEEDNLEAARVLVLAGADVNLKAKDGDTAWDKAESESELEKLLEDNGAIFEEQDDEPDSEPPSN